MKLAAVAPTSSRAATSCRASSWLGPAPGTRPGTPTPDSAAFISTSTHAVNCAQASQTMNVRMERKVETEMSCLSHSIGSNVSGNGQPAVIASASGTPTSSTSSATNARNALTKSPNDRRRTRTGCGVLFVGAVELDGLSLRRRGMAGVLRCGEKGP